MHTVSLHAPMDAAAAAAALLGQHASAFAPQPPAGHDATTPAELHLFSQLAALAASAPPQPHQPPRMHAPRAGARSGEPRSTTAYATRHQAAEQRRRNRINER